MSTAVKERPILFSAPMVRAILAGDKTQTRRIAKDVRHPDLGNVYAPGALVLEREPQHVIERACPYGRPGDCLWVRETWGYRLSATIPRGDHYVWGHTIEYAADSARKVFESPDMDLAGLPRQRPQRESEEPLSYQEYLTSYWRANRPSIHMPRWACRLLLDIGGVRVERLQDISEADALSEGIIALPGGGFGLPGGAFYHAADPRQSFFMLWESINGDGSVQANPWVWVVEFRRIV